MKRCRTCLEDKAESEFHVKDKKSGRLFPDCKKCYNKAYNEKYHADGAAQKKRAREYAARRYAENPVACRDKQKAWREANPEAAKAIARRSDAARRENGKRRAYREANKEAIAKRTAEYRAANKEAIDAYNRVYRATNRELLRLRSANWRKQNPKADRAIRAKWKKANAAIVAAATHRRRTRLAGCAEHFTASEWEALKAAQDYTCLCCGRREPEVKLTVDHVIPVSSPFTSNAITNIQGLCLSCNCAKNARTVDYRPTEPPSETLSAVENAELDHLHAHLQIEREKCEGVWPEYTGPGE